MLKTKVKKQLSLTPKTQEDLDMLLFMARSTLKIITEANYCDPLVMCYDQKAPVEIAKLEHICKEIIEYARYN